MASMVRSYAPRPLPACMECGVDVGGRDQLPYSKRFMCTRCKRAALDDIEERQRQGLLHHTMLRMSAVTILNLWDRVEAERLGIAIKEPSAYSKKPKGRR